MFYAGQIQSAKKPSFRHCRWIEEVQCSQEIEGKTWYDDYVNVLIHP